MSFSKTSKTITKYRKSEPLNVPKEKRNHHKQEPKMCQKCGIHSANRTIFYDNKILNLCSFCKI